MHELRLLTGGVAYGGWKRVSIQRAMDQICGTFELNVSERWPGQDATRRIQPGERCEVTVDGARVITGHVDDVQLAHSAAQHEVGVAGRDRTGDLVDCSAVRVGGQWRGLKIEAIAADLVKPFGIGVRAEVDTGKPLPTFALQEGESVFESIERAARLRALLLVSDGAGNLVITRAGLTRIATELVLGQNILEGRAALSVRDRYSSYTLKGQAAGGDFFSGRAAAEMRATARDPQVQRHRPLVLVGEAPDIAAGLQQRADWEANVRAARSTEIEITVQGWAHAGGLWAPNAIVHVRDEWLRLDHDLLIRAVVLQLDEAGSTTRLALTRADAYTQLPIKQPAVAGAAANGGAFWDGLPKAQAGGR